ncbi:MAG TPA: UDP binding domain-containing protein, partial [Nitrospira sp.]|nr:UDP binding domain-containing protein [Nitrospira sp.]
LQEYGVQVVVHDPLADSEEAVAEYGLHLSEWGSLTNADGIVLAVAHQAYVEMGPQKILDLLRNQEHGVLIDVKSVLDQSKLPKSLAYWRL